MSDIYLNYVIMGLDNGLSPSWRRTINLTHWPLGDVQKSQDYSFSIAIFATVPVDFPTKLVWVDIKVVMSTLVQVMAWCCKATSHNLSQCWPMSVSTYGISSPQWDKVVKKVHEMPCTYDQAIFHPCSVMNPRNSLWITIIINIQKNPFF